jgi:predicted nucleic acid-binding protein
MPSTDPVGEPIFFDAGLFVGALLGGDPRHGEARPLVEKARAGEIAAFTDASILSEVYGALTWEQAQPRHSPHEAAEAVRALIQPPSKIQIVQTGADVALRALDLAEYHGLNARRVHDARHAAAALVAGLRLVYTYDAGDWRAFEADGLRIAGPPSVLRLLGRAV